MSIFNRSKPTKRSSISGTPEEKFGYGPSSVMSDFHKQNRQRQKDNVKIHEQARKEREALAKLARREAQQRQEGLRKEMQNRRELGRKMLEESRLQREETTRAMRGDRIARQKEMQKRMSEDRSRSAATIQRIREDRSRHAATMQRAREDRADAMKTLRAEQKKFSEQLRDNIGEDAFDRLFSTEQDVPTPKTHEPERGPEITESEKTRIRLMETLDQSVSRTIGTFDPDTVRSFIATVQAARDKNNERTDWSIHVAYRRSIEVEEPNPHMVEKVQISGLLLESASKQPSYVF